MSYDKFVCCLKRHDSTPETDPDPDDDEWHEEEDDTDSYILRILRIFRKEVTETAIETMSKKIVINPDMTTESGRKQKDVDEDAWDDSSLPKTTGSNMHVSHVSLFKE